MRKCSINALWDISIIIVRSSVHSDLFFRTELSTVRSIRGRERTLNRIPVSTKVILGIILSMYHMMYMDWLNWWVERNLLSISCKWCLMKDYMIRLTNRILLTLICSPTLKVKNGVHRKRRSDCWISTLRPNRTVSPEMMTQVRCLHGLFSIW